MAWVVYTLPAEFTHEVADPVMVGTGKALTVTAREEAVPFPQVPTPATVTLPEVEPKVRVMVFVPVPAVMEAPAG